MSMMSAFKSSAALILATLLSSQGQAAMVTIQYHLISDVSHFVGVNSGTKPFDPIDAYFTISFDDSMDLAATPLNSTLGITNSFGENINFAYKASDDILNIGQHVAPNYAAYPKGSFGIYIADASTNPYITTFLATSLDNKEQFYGYGKISIVPVITSRVPEPASWAMLIGGFGIIGLGMRRRRTLVTFA